MLLTGRLESFLLLNVLSILRHLPVINSSPLTLFAKLSICAPCVSHHLFHIFTHTSGFSVQCVSIYQHPSPLYCKQHV